MPSREADRHGPVESGDVARPGPARRSGYTSLARPVGISQRSTGGRPNADDSLHIGAVRGIQTPIHFSVGAMGQGIQTPSSSRSEQLAMITALDAARRSETELIETIVARA